MQERSDLNYDLNKLVNIIKRRGLVLVKNVFKKKSCELIKKKLEKVVLKRKKNNEYYGNENCQALDSYFLDDFSLINLIYQKITDEVMSKLIDEDYVLISPCARNPQFQEDLKRADKVSGTKWHTDSRFIQNGKGFNPSLCYTSVIFLDDFIGKAATNYVSKSHLTYKYPKKNYILKKDISYLKGKQGDIAFFDTALWHKMGKSLNHSRWSIFNMYGPWFMKPYFRYWEIKYGNKLNSKKNIFKKLLHFNSVPPLDHNEGLSTLKKS